MTNDQIVVGARRQNVQLHSAKQIMADSSKKRGYISSTSDIDTSLNNSECSTPQNKNKTEDKNLTKTQRKKKLKLEEKEKELNLNMSSSTDKQLKEITEQLRKLTENDNSFIKKIIRETILELTESIIAPAIKQIEVLEGTMHDTVLANDKLKTEIVTLKETLDKKQTKINELQNNIKNETVKRSELINKHEQYSRVNNIRIIGLAEDIESETSHQTADKVLKMINNKLNINMPYHEIDIAHRLGTFKQGSNRRVIVRFVRRQAKSNIMSVKKKLKGSGLSMFDDLTPLNSKVLASTRKKRTDEVDQSWYAKGNIFVKWKHDSSVEAIKFADYDSWVDIPWPDEE